MGAAPFLSTRPSREEEGGGVVPSSRLGLTEWELAEWKSEATSSVSLGYPNNDSSFPIFTVRSRSLRVLPPTSCTVTTLIRKVSQSYKFCLMNFICLYAP